MVIGGQNFNASSREHDMVHQVEVLGRDKTCEVIFFLAGKTQLYKFLCLCLRPFQVELKIFCKVP